MFDGAHAGVWPARRRLAASLVAMVLAAGACSGDASTDDGDARSPAAPAEATDTASASAGQDDEGRSGSDDDQLRNDDHGTDERPPHEADEIVALFDPLLAVHGVRVTRGSLIERWDEGTYDRTPDGDHLALYVSPIDRYSGSDYVDGLLGLTRMLAPLVFERWPGLESFDVCQERRPSSEDDQEPPITVIDMTRDQYDEIDWQTVTLGDIVAAGEAGAFEGYHVAPRLREHRAYRAALRESDAG